MLERGEGGREPGEADDRVEHDVGVGQRGELGEHLGRVAGEQRPVGGHAELGRLGGEQLGVAPGGERRRPRSRRGGRG